MRIFLISAFVLLAVSFGAAQMEDRLQPEQPQETFTEAYLQGKALEDFFDAFVLRNAQRRTQDTSQAVTRHSPPLDLSKTYYFVIDVPEQQTFYDADKEQLTVFAGSYEVFKNLDAHAEQLVTNCFPLRIHTTKEHKGTTELFASSSAKTLVDRSCSTSYILNILNMDECPTALYNASSLRDPSIIYYTPRKGIQRFIYDAAFVTKAHVAQDAAKRVSDSCQFIIGVQLISYQDCAKSHVLSTVRNTSALQETATDAYIINAYLTSVIVQHRDSHKIYRRFDARPPDDPSTISEVRTEIMDLPLYERFRTEHGVNVLAVVYSPFIPNKDVRKGAYDALIANKATVKARAARNAMYAEGVNLVFGLYIDYASATTNYGR